MKIVKDTLLIIGLVLAAFSFILKGFSLYILYAAISSGTSTWQDALSLVGEVKIALIMLAISLVLDSVAIFLSLLVRF